MIENIAFLTIEMFYFYSYAIIPVQLNDYLFKHFFICTWQLEHTSRLLFKAFFGVFCVCQI